MLFVLCFCFGFGLLLGFFCDFIVGFDCWFWLVFICFCLLGFACFLFVSSVDPSFSQAPTDKLTMPVEKKSRSGKEKKAGRKKKKEKDEGKNDMMGAEKQIEVSEAQIRRDVGNYVRFLSFSPFPPPFFSNPPSPTPLSLHFSPFNPLCPNRNLEN